MNYYNDDLGLYTTCSNCGDIFPSDEDVCQICGKTTY